MFDVNKFRQIFVKTAKSFGKSIPIMFSVILLISIIDVFVSKQLFSKIFSGNVFLDSFVGSFFGSLLAGNPITSYVISGELLEEGVSLIAVTSFIVAWVTVGIVQLPVEIEHLGRRFSVVRNALAFLSSFIVAIIVFFGVGAL